MGTNLCSPCDDLPDTIGKIVQIHYSQLSIDQ